MSNLPDQEPAINHHLETISRVCEAKHGRTMSPAGVAMIYDELYSRVRGNRTDDIDANDPMLTRALIGWAAKMLS